MNILAAAAALETRMDLSCMTCGRLFSATSPAPCAINVFVAFTKSLKCPSCRSKELAFGQNRTVAEDVALSKTSRQSSFEARLWDWLDNGETGQSSRAIAGRLSGYMGVASDPTAHPHDVSDLKRCCHLLRRMPEFAAHIDNMAVVSPAWARLAPRFLELVDLLAQETGDDLARVPAPRTAALLDAILAEAKAA